MNNAWKHVKAVVVNDGKAADLYDLLASSGKDIIDPMPIGVSASPLAVLSWAFSRDTSRNARRSYRHVTVQVSICKWQEELVLIVPAGTQSQSVVEV